MTKSALVMRKEMDFEKHTHSKWTRNKPRVVRRSIDNLKWQVRKQNKIKTRQDKTWRKFTNVTTNSM